MRKMKFLGLTFLVLLVLAIPVLSWTPVQKISTHPDNITRGDDHPQIAADASGNSYVAWQGSDGRDQEIYWVRIDATGTPGTVQKISTHPDNITEWDYHPQIAADSSGNSYVTWHCYDRHDMEIYWVKIDSSGVPGIVQKISTQPDNINWEDYDPQIVADSSGNSYVTWCGYDGHSFEIYLVRIDVSGVAGTVQKISTHLDNVNGNDYYPQIVADSSGNLYITWEGGDDDREIYWAKIDSTGVPGTVQKISTHPDNVNRDDFDPQIAADASGNSYVAWWCCDGENCWNRIGDFEIYWVKIDSTGVPGIVQKISTHPDNVTRDDWHPQIAADSSGNSYVTWSGRGWYNIYWVKVDSSGVSGTVQKISTHPDNVNERDEYPQIITDVSGNSYVTWQGHDVTDWEIYWVKVDSSGVSGTVQKISTHPDNVTRDDDHPQIAADSSGNSYVTWYGYDGHDYEIYFTLNIPDSIGPITSNTSVTPNPTNCAPTVTVTATVDDSGTGNSNIQQTEYFIDVIGANGTGTPLAAQDGFDSPTENVVAVIDVTGLSPGLHTVFVHGRDALGTWGATDSYSLTVVQDCTGPVTSNTQATPNPTNCAANVTLTATVDDSGTGNNNIQQAEYFVGAPGPNGTGTPMAAQNGFNSPTETVTAAIDVTGLSPGLHTVYVHGRDVTGNWGAVQPVSLTVTCQKAIQTETPPTIINQQIRPLAQYHMSVAEDLSIEAQTLLSQVKAQGIDTSSVDELIRKAEEFLAKAQEYFRGKNYIAANIYALKAVQAYQEAIEFLTELLD